MKKKKIIIPLMIIVLFLAAGAWYVGDYYHSSEEAGQFLKKDGVVKAVEIEEGLFLDGPGEEDAVIFYPGAKVEYTAYVPLLYQLAENGVDCFLVKMPFNLAVLGQNKADNLLEQYDYSKWYLSGHSLGGAMAASYAAEHTGELEGLILLAAYPTKNLNVDGFSVLSVYGSEDGVLNMEKYNEGKSLMPETYTELCIKGGNHAYFGNYGAQKGDGKADISREAQQEQTVDAILGQL